MARRTEIFWTDIHQAQERLTGTVILYDNEPVFVDGIVNASASDTSPSIPRAAIRQLGVSKGLGKGQRKILNSPKFERFRRLPNLGWMNMVSNPKVGPLFVSRRPVAGSRLHGLANANVRVENFVISPENFYLDGGGYSLTNIIYDEGFCDMHHGRYPSLAAILTNIKEGSGIAYSRDFCVWRDNVGIRWLFHKSNKIGIFTGIDTLNLFTKFNYLRETIIDDPAFTLNNIREF